MNLPNIEIALCVLNDFLIPLKFHRHYVSFWYSYRRLHFGVPEVNSISVVFSILFRLFPTTTDFNCENIPKLVPSWMLPLHKIVINSNLNICHPEKIMGNRECTYVSLATKKYVQRYDIFMLLV